MIKFLKSWFSKREATLDDYFTIELHKSELFSLIKALGTASGIRSAQLSGQGAYGWFNRDLMIENLIAEKRDTDKLLTKFYEILGHGRKS